MGHCSEGFTVNASVASILFHEARDVVVVITESLMLSQHAVTQDGKMILESQVKLSGGVGAAAGDRRQFEACWVAGGILATCAGGRVVRIWDLANEDSITLDLPGTLPVTN
jgi:hypothetical protein